jgi:hypothetical protein
MTQAINVLAHRQAYSATLTHLPILAAARGPPLRPGVLLLITITLVITCSSPPRRPLPHATAATCPKIIHAPLCQT